MIKVDETDPVGELEPSFPYRDVQIKRNTDVKNFYDLQTEIGRGKFGTVYRCREKSTGLSLAAKFVSVGRKEDRRNVEREVDIMRSLQHPRLLQLYDAYEFDKNVCLILELIEGGELFERVIDDDFVLTEKACTIFMRQICEGIQFIHQQHILHLDLKPENILCLTKTGNRIKIIDFGLARRYEPGKKLQVLFGTPEFVAPEVVNFDQIGFNTDMWSVGVICYVLLSGLSPFMGDTDVETMANVTIAKYDFDDEVFDDISEDAKDFISKLLVKEKENRMVAEACLHHRWLRRKPPPPPAKPPARQEQDKKQQVEEVNNNSVSVEDKNNVINKLEGAKDNLKSIVERWTEHPDSPYIFDTTAHTISPCPSDSILAAGHVHMEPEATATTAAPSADSIADNSADSNADSKQPAEEPPQPSPSVVATTTSPVPESHVEAVLPVDLHERLATGLASMTERRASDSNCFVRLKSHHHDVHDRINLADEIRKLSDKLFRMASSTATPTSPTPSPASPVVNPLVTLSDDNNVESTTVTETSQGCTTTKTTFKSTPSRSGGALSENFAAKAVQTQIPTRKFWPIEPRRLSSRVDVIDVVAVDTDTAQSPAGVVDPSPATPSGEDAGGVALAVPGAAPWRTSRSTSRRRGSSSSTTTNTTHSAPQSPRWSPDPELPLPPSSDLTKDLLLRLLHRLDTAPSGSSSTSASQPPSPVLGLLGDWTEPFFRSKTASAAHLDKKRTLITSHSGGM